MTNVVTIHKPEMVYDDAQEMLKDFLSHLEEHGWGDMPIKGFALAVISPSNEFMLLDGGPAPLILYATELLKRQCLPEEDYD